MVLPDHVFRGQACSDTIGQSHEEIFLEFRQRLYIALKKHPVLPHQLLKGLLHHFIGHYGIGLVPHHPRQVLDVRRKAIGVFLRTCTPGTRRGCGRWLPCQDFDR